MAEIESTLVFDTDERFTGFDDPRELIAEGIHEREQGKRSIRTEYIRDEDRLLVRSHYRYGRDRRNQSIDEWTISNGSVEYNGQELDKFIHDNFHADPEAALGEEYESMVSTGDRR